MTRPKSKTRLVNNLVIDGDFSDEASTAWRFERATPESLAARQTEEGNAFFASSLSGYAWQEIRAKATGIVDEFGGRVAILASPGGISDRTITVTNEWADYELEHTVPNIGGSDAVTLVISGGLVTAETTTLFDDLSLKLKI